MEKHRNLINMKMPWLQFKKPLFYNAKIGIRFEIGNPSLDVKSIEYLVGATNRAKDIFEDLFFENDSLILVINAHRHISQIKDREIALESQITDCIIDYIAKDVEVFYEILPNVYYEDDKDYKTIRFYIEINLEKLKYGELITRICNMDFKYQPYIEDEIYVVCCERNIIYHLYDDRGVDVISDDITTLNFIYEKRNNWILDYDRERIERIFKSNNTSDVNIT